MKKITMNIMLLCGLITIGNVTTTRAQSTVLLDDGNKQVECVTEENYQEFIRPQLKANINKLRQEGKLNFANDATTAKVGDGTVPLSWPLRMHGDYKDIDGVNDYFVITNFADLNHDEYYRLDWDCATYENARNYDQHNGADILPYPFMWEMMDDESVEIIAAADGEVIQRYDGNTVDRNCASPHEFNSEPFNGGYYGNFIALMHSDSSITVYAHMKNGTVANLELGEFVEAGQFLGKMGSSGNSTAPHLHFEVRPCVDCQYIEPWFDAAGCNDDVTESQWISQIPYNDPKILRVATHLNLPVYKTCAEYEAGANEDENLVNHFSTTDNLFITAAIGDLFGDIPIYMEIINSAGTIVASDIYNSPYYQEYKATVLFTELLTGYASGTYKIRISYNGRLAYHYFTVGCPAATTLIGTHTGVRGYLNGDFIASTASIAGLSTNNIFYQAENYVKLNPGFVAAQNSEFHAQINDCTVGGMREMEEELIGENNLLVSPNPGFGIFSINYTADVNSDMRLIIRNLYGNIIYESELFEDIDQINQTIDLTDYAKGIYLVEIQKPEGSITQQVVIQ